MIILIFRDCLHSKKSWLSLPVVTCPPSLYYQCCYIIFFKTSHHFFLEIIKISMGGSLNKFLFWAKWYIFFKPKWRHIWNNENHKVHFYEEQIPYRYLLKLKPVMWEKVGYHSRPYTRNIHDGISHWKTTIFYTNGIHDFL